MQDFIINIGLNVGFREPMIQLDSVIYHLNNTFAGTFKDTLKDENNGGTWGKERVLIVEGKTGLNISEFKKVVANLCELMNQEAMPFCLGTSCELVYGSRFKGVQVNFEEQYFLRK